MLNDIYSSDGLQQLLKPGPNLEGTRLAVTLLCIIYTISLRREMKATYTFSFPVLSHQIPTSSNIFFS